MEKRPAAQAVIAFVSGISFGLLMKWYMTPMVLFCYALINFVWIKRRKYRTIIKLSGVWMVFFLLGVYHTKTEVDYRDRYKHCLECESPAIMQGQIYKKEKKNNQYLIYLKNVILRINNTSYSTNHVLVYLNTDQYRIGKIIVAKGKIKKFSSAANEGGFQQESYYHSLKIDYEFEISSLLGCYGKQNTFLEKLYAIRNKLKQNYINIANNETADVLSTMILGDKNGLDNSIKEMYQRAGISHILVISGLHISMIGTALYWLLRKIRIGMIPSAVLAEIFLISYAQMTGFGVSTIRAVLMFGLAMIAKCVGKTYDRITALGIAVLYMLFENPFLVFNSGFQLSVGAMIGIILAGEDARTWKMSGMIQIVTLPVISYIFYEVPVCGILVNLLLLPLSAWLLASGIAGAVAAGIGRCFGQVLVLPAYWILVFYEKVCLLTEKLPYSMWIVGRPSGCQIILFYVLLFVGMIAREKGFVIHKKGFASACKKLVWITCLFFILGYKAPQRTTVDILDVGQGDASCIRLETGATFFVDGGSSDVSQVGKYRILPYLKIHGIRQVDYWFVSHLDTDHVSGLLEALEYDYSIKSILLSESAVKNENWKKLLQLAEKKNIPISYMKPGDKICCNGTTIRCIFPDEAYKADDANARSMVLLLQEENFQGILTGDIDSSGEKWLLEHTDLSDITWYKAAHHGSKYSNSAAWLEKLSPIVSTVSYGVNNSYGHPNLEAIHHMERSGSRVLRTAECGEISLVLEDNYMKITNYRKPLEVIRYPVIK